MPLKFQISNLCFHHQRIVCTQEQVQTDVNARKHNRKKKTVNYVRNIDNHTVQASIHTRSFDDRTDRDH